MYNVTPAVVESQSWGIQAERDKHRQKASKVYCYKGLASRGVRAHPHTNTHTHICTHTYANFPCTSKVAEAELPLRSLLLVC